ncbi:hypothetical protein WJ01_25425 [Burkholderia vietnamiensis]|nr:hypothetical protein WJ01_25425 [Burkholderia vietnamiensis]
MHAFSVTMDDEWGARRASILPERGRRVEWRVGIAAAARLSTWKRRASCRHWPTAVGAPDAEHAGATSFVCASRPRGERYLRTG